MMNTKDTKNTKESGRRQRSKNEHPPLPKETENIASQIIDSAFAVHKALGPGLLESAYEGCLCHELSKKGFLFETQKSLPVHYDGMKIAVGFRADLIVEDRVIVELKSVDKITALHQAQLLTYLRLSGKRLGLILNFNTIMMRHGIKRMVI